MTTWIDGTILSGLIGKVISDGIDVSREKIKKAVMDRANPHQNTESQIYSLIVEVLFQIFRGHSQKNPDRIYTGAEIMLQDFKDETIDRTDAVKNGLRCICADADNRTCAAFADMLDYTISKDCYATLYREILLITNRKIDKTASEIKKKIGETDERMETNFEEIRKTLNDMNQNQKAVSPDLFQNNKKHDYVKIWNSRLFLHQSRDDRPLTLADAFIMPYHSVHCNLFLQMPNDQSPLTGIPFEKAIERFRELDGSVTMLLTGVPGIGKTSVTAWLSNKYQDDPDLIVLRFRDWDREELTGGLLRAVCTTLACRPSDLNGKMLVLDGFDEMKRLDIREKILAAFFNDICDLHHFKCIITSRPAYIDASLFSYVFELKSFEIYRIRAFYQKITGKTLNIQKIDPDNLDVLGVPVILYMAIMSHIDLTERTTRPGLYSHIFAGHGGIFDRFHYGGRAYDEGAHPLRNSRNIRIYLSFLSEVAYKMYKTNTLLLSREACKIPELEFQDRAVEILEFPIKHLFESTESQIEFIHKSIYEYFVAEYLLKKISECIQRGQVDALAGVLGELLKDNNLNDEIAEYLAYKIRRQETLPTHFAKEPIQIPAFSVTARYLNDAFSVMLKNGMTYFCETKPDNLIVRETTVFCNLMRMFEHCLDTKHRLQVRHSKEFSSYLSLQNIWTGNQHLMYIDFAEAKFENVSLRKLTFEDVSLKGVVFHNVDLTDTRFENVDLSGASFSQSKMKHTLFEHVNFTKVDIEDCEFVCGRIRDATIDAKMKASRLEGTIFQKNYINRINFTDSNLRNASFEGNYIVDYTLIGLHDAVLDAKLILQAEKIFGKRVRFCKVDLCDSIFPYAEYRRIRAEKLSVLQEEILDVIEKGKNYAE